MTEAPFSSARRVTTGVDAGGRSVVIRDEIIRREDRKLLAWAADAPPVMGDATAPQIGEWWPPPGGVRVSLSTRAPEGQAPEGQTAGPSGFPDIHDAQGFHASCSVDVVVMIHGRIWLELDDGVTVELAAGDVLVQNGARHRWRNLSDDWPLMAAVIVGAETAMSGGR